MLFITVGYQMAFDRLIGAVDTWAADHADVDFMAQIGPDGRIPEHMNWVRFLEPNMYKEQIASCDAIVAHAGMGSILLALEYGKPILVMPRKGDLMETRNDHQIATAKKFASSGQVLVAMDETELPEKLDALMHASAAERISSVASEELITTIRSFIHGS